MLPKFLKKYFWDCDFSKLNLKEYENFITVRILNYGNDESIMWLMSNIDKSSLINSIKKSREIDNKTRNYWEIILDIK